MGVLDTSFLGAIYPFLGENLGHPVKFFDFNTIFEDIFSSYLLHNNIKISILNEKVAYQPFLILRNLIVQ